MRIKSHIKPLIAFSIALTLFSACAPVAVQPTAVPSATVTIVPPTETPVPSPTPTPIPDGYVEYFTQSGDTLPAVAAHFGEVMEKIFTDANISASTILDPGTRLLVPEMKSETTPADLLFPDSEIVDSPGAINFNIWDFAAAQGGFLATYEELMVRGMTPASDVIYQLALEHAINPRILLALMEAESGWVRSEPEEKEGVWYPFGYIRKDRSGIYHQTGWAIRYLIEGYYGWRTGTLTELTFPDGETLRLAGNLNAGTVAVLHFFTQSHNRAEWEALVYGDEGIRAIHDELFNGAIPADSAEWAPLFPAGITQPELALPLPPNQVWNLTGGPHSAWGRYGARAALDFAPPADRPGCGNSVHWTTAAAPGKVVRVGNGVVVIDLDKDGHEQTGWVLVYMHVANADRVALNTILKQDERIGHPSCEGGSASGIHIHIARKYNGEWILADGGIPFEMSGYTAKAEEAICDYAWWGWCRGTLFNGEHTVTADPFGNSLTRIFRPESDLEFLQRLTPTP